jgi:hypothetical protein
MNVSLDLTFQTAMKITIAAALLAAGAALTVGTAHADPTPDYTWECDTDSYGHSTCRAEPIPHCSVSADGQWVVVVPPGGTYPGLPAPCNTFGPGGVTNLVRAPYPARPPYFPPQPLPIPAAPAAPVHLPPGYKDGD